MGCAILKRLSDNHNTSSLCARNNLGILIGSGGEEPVPLTEHIWDTISKCGLVHIMNQSAGVLGFITRSNGGRWDQLWRINVMIVRWIQ